MDKELLAKKFCPTLRFHREEKYTPTNFIELFKKNKSKIEFKCPNPEEKWKKKAKFDKKTGLLWFAPAIYVHFLEDVGILIRHKIVQVSLIIQYHFYFAYNEYQWGIIQVPFLMHPHDWEQIMVALNKNGELVSFSVSAHGTLLEICSGNELQQCMIEGFRCNKGSHNFGSIFQTPNKPQKDDIIITPETLVPIGNGEYIPFKDTIIILENKYDIEFLKKFSFYPIVPPWERYSYNPTTWKPKYWSKSPFQRFIELSKDDKGAP